MVGGYLGRKGSAAVASTPPFRGFGFIGGSTAMSSEQCFYKGHITAIFVACLEAQQPQPEAAGDPTPLATSRIPGCQ